MKLQKIHLFALLIFVLMASTFGWTVREYMTNKGDVDGIDGEPESEDIMPGKGGRLPFIPGVPTPKHKRKRMRCIPDGDDDYYVLKSQVVPPVCPKCPDSRACPSDKKCPPCPAPQRCPEPAFECKKVPNYNVGGSFGNNSAGEAVFGGGAGSGAGGAGGSGASSNSTGGGGAPMPRLNSFSQF
uniref:Uncharacterized protein n=1 Tax=viral metagenome TaxID=1070528 RepID=A0A6C0C3Q5_9ZZZZ